MKRTTLFILFLGICHVSSARKQRTILAPGTKIYIESKNAAEKIHLEKVLEYKGVYNVVDRPEKAIYTLKIMSKGGVNYRAFIQILDSKTNELIQTTAKVNTLWSVTFNPKLKAMKKLARKRLKCAKSHNS